MQKRVADASHAPKRFNDADFMGPLNYAYHFDAGLYAQHLRRYGPHHPETVAVPQASSRSDWIDRGARSQPPNRHDGPLLAVRRLSRA